ncbi:MAG: hypothetical protein ACTSW2_04730 [Alphaproteobacteria bacterium]
MAFIVLAINTAVDPLWYWRGNIVTGENFAFNERFAKLNRFLRTVDRYDCVIFGSSRATLLDQTRITDYRCANLAFASGVVSEFVATARYIKAQGFSPKLVIVGIDAFNYWRSMNPNLTDFVKRGQPPPGWIPTYLTASALNFSLRTLSGVSPIARAYDANFIGMPDKDAPIYRPPSRDEMVAKAWKFDASRKEMFFALREVFPEARYIGYVPPTSAWHTVQELHLTGYTGRYLEAMKSIADRFDVLYDFSVPSKLTMQPENTYDGSHFRAAVNASIVDALQDRSSNFGINVRSITVAEYARIYNDAIDEFLQGLHAIGPDDSR